MSRCRSAGRAWPPRRLLPRLLVPMSRGSRTHTEYTPEGRPAAGRSSRCISRGVQQSAASEEELLQRASASDQRADWQRTAILGHAVGAQHILAELDGGQVLDPAVDVPSRTSGGKCLVLWLMTYWAPATTA